MYLIGMWFGAVIGTLLIGGFLGWAIHKVFHLNSLYSDGIGLALLFIGALIVNGREIGLPEAIAVYGIASLVSYFVLVKYVRPDKTGTDA